VAHHCLEVNRWLGRADAVAVSVAHIMGYSSCFKQGLAGHAGSPGAVSPEASFFYQGGFPRQLGGKPGGGKPGGAGTDNNQVVCLAHRLLPLVGLKEVK
jgi:hypothetical protein